MAAHGYKKYMKKEAQQPYSLVKVFILSFCCMLLLATLIINSFSKNMSVDTSIGEYKEQQEDELYNKKIVDNRLAEIQSEDHDKSFSDLMKNPSDEKKSDSSASHSETTVLDETSKNELNMAPSEIVYKVFIGNYTTSEQAKVAKEIIQESNSGLNPIVKCLGANSYTLQVGLFKIKQVQMLY